MFEEFGDFADEKPEDVTELVRAYEDTRNGESEKFFDEDQFVLIGENYVISNKPKDALEVCQRGLQKYPFSVDLLLMRAQLLTREGRFIEAHEAIDAAELFNPTDVDIQLARVSLLLNSGKQNDAIAKLNSIIDTVPNDELEVVLYHIGLSFMQSDRPKLAQDYFRRCIEMNPTNELAVYEYLFTNTEVAENQVFEAFFTGFTDKNPYDERAWYNLGLCYANSENFENASNAFRYATDVNAKFSSAWFQLGMAYMNLEQWADAVEAFDTVLTTENQPNAELLTHLAAAHEHQENFTVAIKYYKSALDFDPDYDEAFYGIASCLYELGQAYEAITYAKRAVEINEFNANYFLLLGDSESTVGNVISACEAYEKASTLDPSYADVWLQWSEVFFEQEEYSTAADLIGEALEVIPDDAELFYRMFVYLAHDKRFKEALSYLEIGLTLDYDLHTCIYDFFTTLDMQKKINQFVERYKK